MGEEGGGGGRSHVSVCFVSLIPDVWIHTFNDLTDSPEVCLHPGGLGGHVGNEVKWEGQRDVFVCQQKYTEWVR